MARHLITLLFYAGMWVGISEPLCAGIIVSTGFETTGDSWAFTPTPVTYNTEMTGDVEEVNGDEDVWAAIKQFTGDIDSADSGSRFWGMQDLDNPNGGGAFDHILAFDNIDVSVPTGVTVHFGYNALGFDIGDDLSYEVFFDDVGQGSVLLVDGALGGVSTTGWESVSLAVPDAVGLVRINLVANQNGAGDFAGFDSVVLQNGAVPEPTLVPILAFLSLACVGSSRRRRTT
jgi:hypothetical protein